MKKKLSLLLTLTLICAAIMCVCADASENSVKWSKIDSITFTLNFNKTKGIAKAVVVGSSGVTSISGTITVYRQVGSSWVFVGSSPVSSSSSILNTSYSFTGITGNYYKAVLDITVFSSSGSESTSVEAYAYC